MKYRHFFILFLLLLPVNIFAKTLPSFDGIEKQLRSNDKITLNDDNQVLDNFYILETKLVEAEIDDFKLIISSKWETGYGYVLLKNKDSDEIAKVNVKVTGGSFGINQKTSEFLADLSPAGAVYEVYDSNNELVDTITINEQLFGASKALFVGNYFIKQVKAGYGYQITPVFKQKIQGGNFYASVNVINELIKKDISILKRSEVSKNNFVPLENIEFQIYRNDVLYKTIKTDSNGEINLSLPYGNYSFISPEDNLKIIVDNKEIPLFYDLTNYYEDEHLNNKEKDISFSENDIGLKETAEVGEEKQVDEGQEIIDHPHTGDNIIFAIINLFVSIFGLLIVRKLLKQKCNK